MNTDRVRTTTPYRVDLPPLAHLTPSVRAAAEHYLGLHDEYHRRVGAVQTAQRGVAEAETADRRASAATLAGGGTVTKPRGEAERAETAKADAVALREAYRGAVGIAYGELTRALRDAAPAWSAEVAADHAEAVARYEAATRELQEARDDVAATGELHELLTATAEVSPTVPNLGRGAPGHRARFAASHAGTALAESLSPFRVAAEAVAARQECVAAEAAKVEGGDTDAA
ncbi:hypothetical protein ABKW28_15975 [Nocardioides sp. 31GB23]|uniref:hypothetical protein n=1 Tax=Nocardioides sp. 31GB23 TaxID=3156065 RepID=UPI0032AF6441